MWAYVAIKSIIKYAFAKGISNEFGDRFTWHANLASSYTSSSSRIYPLVTF